MSSYPSQKPLPTAAPVIRLIEEFHKLPGIGPKSAQRLTYHLVRMPAQEAQALAEAILAVKERVGLCSLCWNITDQNPCSVCASPDRDRTCLCVVEDPMDVLAVERTGVYKGLYHVLHGAISPVNGIGPEELRIRELLDRLRGANVQSGSTPPPEEAREDGSVGEVILATNANLEGEATAMYLQRLLSPLGVRVTRLAQGLSTGGELEYADELTLMRAFQGRQEFA